MRKRLSWDEEKVAEIRKQADPYSMNQDHKNPPVEKYRTGDPSAWAEDPHMATPWKNEGRVETGHPAPAREAVVAGMKMEDKAIKCITVAQRMLPGASDEAIEEQATDLMYMPERAVVATIQRQSTLAETMVQSGDEEEKEDEEEEGKEAKKEEKPEDEEEEGKEAKKEEKPEDEKEEEKSATEEVEAGKKKEYPEKGKKEEEEEKSAGDDEKKEEEEEEEEKSAGEKEYPEKGKKEEEEEKSAGKKEEEMPEDEEGEKKEADLLDVLFDSAENPEPTEKTGAKKLSGMVRKASVGDSDLSKLWDTPPDVSKIFRSR